MNAKFFVITAIGFEADSLKEIQFYLSSQQVSFKTEVHKGGIEVECPLEVGVKLNYILKLATRVLLRIEEFPVYHFSELEKKLKKLSLDKFFKEKQEVLVKVDSKKSKLGQEKKIFQVFANVYTKYKLFSKPSEAPETAMILYVDIFKDNCRLSFDTTGEPLYKRQTMKFNAEAPMRETIVHWGLNRMLEEVSPWEKPLRFVDPFCGSGTLLLETLDYFKKNSRPFSFEKSFSIKPIHEDKDPKEIQKFPFKEYMAVDIDSKALEVCSQNLKEKTKETVIVLKSGDSTQPEKSESLYESWIFSNLPYGKRVEDKLPKDLTDVLYQNYKPRVMGLFYPEKLSHPKAKKALHHGVENGGLKLYFSVLVF